YEEPGKQRFVEQWGEERAVGVRLCARVDGHPFHAIGPLPGSDGRIRTRRVPEFGEDHRPLPAFGARPAAGSYFGPTRKKLVEAGSVVIGQWVKRVDPDHIERAPKPIVGGVAPVRRVGERAMVAAGTGPNDGKESARRTAGDPATEL